MQIRPIQTGDWKTWRRMTEALLPGEPPEEYDADMRRLQRSDDAAVFIAERPDGSICGFVEVGVRAYADGCRTSPVGYIEAWYVDPDIRRKGYGRALLRAAETWARRRGYSEMASDARVDNTLSHKAHLRSGYSEVDRVVQFRKSLDSSA